MYLSPNLSGFTNTFKHQLIVSWLKSELDKVGHTLIHILWGTYVGIADTCYFVIISYWIVRTYRLGAPIFRIKTWLFYIEWTKVNLFRLLISGCVRDSLENSDIRTKCQLNMAALRFFTDSKVWSERVLRACDMEGLFSTISKT